MKIFAWDNGEGPWGKPRKATRPQQPAGEPRAPQREQPDIEDVVNQMAERLRGFWRQQRSGGGPRGFGGGGDFARRIPPEWWVLIVFGLWALSGLYIIGPEQQGVVTRFGAYARTSDSGLNYHVPWPVEHVVKVPVTRVNLLEVGFRDANNYGNDIDVPEESLMLTGDENIVDLDFTVNWKISDPAAYLFNVADPEGTLADVAESVMRDVLGKHPIDDALTNNKAEIQQQVKARMQRVLDSYGMGVNILEVALQQVNPPKEVIDAFRDVQAAAADKQRLINEAKGYANKILPLARGQAAKITQDAEAYKAAKIAEATGDAERFNEQVAAYEKAPAVTRERMYMDTMQDVMQNVHKVVLTGKGGQNVLPFLPLDKVMGLPGGKGAE